jgi:hypothetical protein
MIPIRITLWILARPIIAAITAHMDRAAIEWAESAGVMPPDEAVTVDVFAGAAPAAPVETQEPAEPPVEEWTNNELEAWLTERYGEPTPSSTGECVAWNWMCDPEHWSLIQCLEGWCGLAVKSYDPITATEAAKRLGATKPHPATPPTEPTP